MEHRDIAGQKKLTCIKNVAQVSVQKSTVATHHLSDEPDIGVFRYLSYLLLTLQIAYNAAIRQWLIPILSTFTMPNPCAVSLPIAMSCL